MKQIIKHKRFIIIWISLQNNQSGVHKVLQCSEWCTVSHIKWFQYSVCLLYAAFYNICTPGTQSDMDKSVPLIGWSMPFVNVDTHSHSHTHTNKETRTSSVSGLHADGSVQPDDLAVNHGVLGQWCHHVGKLSGVSQAWGEGHLAGEEGAHLLWKSSQEGSGKQTWRKKEEEASDVNVSAHIQMQKKLFIYVHSPGAIVMTLMPMGARSRAIGRVIPTMPPLEAEYAAWPTWRKENVQKIKLINRAINELFHLCVSSCVCIKWPVHRTLPRWLC